MLKIKIDRKFTLLIFLRKKDIYNKGIYIYINRIAYYRLKRI